MRHTLVPVLLFTVVALSSSNVLPIMTDRLDPNGMNGQQYDNILSNSYSKPVHKNIFYTVPFGTSENSQLMRKLAKYLNANSDQTQKSFNDVINAEDNNYDGEGFRKEQWHNYPRQLDRLHEYLTHYHNGDIKRNADTDDPGIEDYGSTKPKEEHFGDISTNEYLLDSNEGNNMYDSVISATNPLLILQVKLACLNNRLGVTRSAQSEAQPFRTQFSNEMKTNGLEAKLFPNVINTMTKVKREGVTSQETQNAGENTPSKRKTKRLFSLWSRLQSMSQKGHELPHRRHLAFYGFQDGEGGGGGTLTAETRATFMRPPGSPLRWG